MSINIDDLTISQVKQLQGLIGMQSVPKNSNYFQSLIGKKCIVRTHLAGVHFGELVERDRKEVILGNSRRLWYWKTTNGGISLSEVANSGLHKDSKVCDVVANIWLEAIEIIPCTDESIKNIEAANVYKA